MGKVVAIILARGGSKGIPGKNTIDFCGKPLIVWTIEQLQQAVGIDSIWVSSDKEEILSISQACGAEIIHRPATISGDSATSESGWLHALKIAENKVGRVDTIIAPQVTSPLRESQDIERGLRDFQEQKCDSMFSCSVAEDLFFWEKMSDGKLRSVNYDYKNRNRRQEIPKQYIENGSFYIFKPDVLRQHNNRFGGKIGLTQMEFWKMFEIDSMEDLKMCEALMRAFLLNNQ
ncbi:MAG: acylneuraminate cytidylyltransferase family protein [Deltaproteobacteria bacterium]|nr:acylneuraminate cytidylyltransferase family protein [Deltaproteobacteria bacterium]MBW2741303.1 acylneuraminate cytidylyltransferase family protein [Deltaproteobacteria bacterium]